MKWKASSPLVPDTRTLPISSRLSGRSSHQNTDYPCLLCKSVMYKRWALSTRKGCQIVGLALGAKERFEWSTGKVHYIFLFAMCTTAIFVQFRLFPSGFERSLRMSDFMWNDVVRLSTYTSVPSVHVYLSRDRDSFMKLWEISRKGIYQDQNMIESAIPWRF